jgi:hypothetical protein
MVLALAAAYCVGVVLAQSPYEQFRAHNARAAAVQPTMVSPLVAADPRLIQYIRVAVSQEYTAAGEQTVNYGNARGAGIIAANRFEFDWMPPSYIQHNSTAGDGFGDTAVAAKVRIESRNTEAGGFDVAAMLGHCFATGSHTNGAKTDSFTPTVAGAYAFKRLDMIQTVSGTLPTGKIAAQGRTIAWNALMQAHATKHVWFEMENNATYYFAGPHDGRMQNFVTPASFYVLRRKGWEPTHAFAVFTCGMQVSTSRFHTYNHNLISEMRILF